MSVMVSVVAPASAPSKFLQTLEASLAKLELAFLPKNARTAPDVYSDEETTQARAYVVFVHAELEDYLEQCCRDRAARALSALQTNGVVTSTAFSLVCHVGDKIALAQDIAKYGERDRKLAPDFPAFNPAVTRSILACLKEAVSNYTEMCRKNNGVKEENLLRLLVPLGLDPFAMDAAWTAEMNALGRFRGSHAHRGMSAIQQIADPFQPREAIRRILEGPPGAGPLAGGTLPLYSLRSLDGALKL